MNQRTLCFGELMVRFSPGDYSRLTQQCPGTLKLDCAGAEANVAVALAHLGLHSRFVSTLPKHHDLAEACLTVLRSHRVDVESVHLSDQGRLGLYFLEHGVNQRGGKVLYDRSYSSFSMQEPSAYDWNTLLHDCDHLHLSGITPALSEVCFQASLQAVQVAKKLGVYVSMDLNYREKLWNWHPHKTGLALAQDCFAKLVEHVDLLIANQHHLELCLKLPAMNHSTDIAVSSQSSAKACVERFPHLDKVALTLRHSLSASHQEWGAMLYDTHADMACFAPSSQGTYQPYSIAQVVDRVGAGDAFAAGLLYQIQQKANLKHTLEFAAAYACLAHSTPGDLALYKKEEIEALAFSSNSYWLSR